LLVSEDRRTAHGGDRESDWKEREPEKIPNARRGGPARLNERRIPSPDLRRTTSLTGRPAALSEERGRQTTGEIAG